MYLMLDTDGLVDSTSDCEELSFSNSDVYYVVNCFDNWSVVWVDMWYGGSNVISYASIWDDHWGMRIIGSTNSNVVKITYMIFDVVL